MDVTSEAARVIAALCNCTPEEAASVVRAHQMRQVSAEYAFYQYPPEQGITLLQFSQLLGVANRAKVRVGSNGQVKIECPALKGAGFVAPAVAVQQLEQAGRHKAAPAYIKVLFQLFETANERLAAEVAT